MSERKAWIISTSFDCSWLEARWLDVLITHVYVRVPCFSSLPEYFFLQSTVPHIQLNLWPFLTFVFISVPIHSSLISVPLSLSPREPEWGKSIKFHMQFRMRTPSRRISPWNGREICKVCVVQGERRSFLGYFALSQPAHLIFSLCQVSPSLKQPNFWFSFMQSTLLSMLRCPILVPASPTWPWWVGSKI